MQQKSAPRTGNMINLRQTWIQGLLIMVLVCWSSVGFADTLHELDHCLLVSQVGLFANLGMGLRILFLVVMLSFFPLRSLLAAVYYVRKTGNNSNAGTTPATAWLTFAKAASSTAPGDYVYFGAGTYAETVDPTVSGTSGNLIRFIADTDGTRTGDAGLVTISVNADGVKLDKDNYLYFEGFRIIGNGNEGFYAKDSTGLVVRKCEIYSSKFGCKTEGATEMLMVNCLIRNNSDKGMELKNNSNITIWNSTIANNTKCGIKVKDSAICTVKNTIIANNGEEGIRYENGTLTHAYNIFYGNTPNFFGFTQDSTELVADPKFINAAGGDYHLQTTSPAVNAGTSASGIADNDMDGLYRPIDSVWEIGCYEKSLVGPLLMVVSSTTNLDSQDKAKLLLMQSWGYAVYVIDDDATQTAFNTAAANNLVAFVSEKVVGTSLGTKLVNAKIGVVNEDPDLTDEFGFSSASTVSSQNSLNVTNATHYITSSFLVGSYSLYSSSQLSVALDGTKSKELQVISKWGTADALSLLDIGAARYDSGTVKGRRVQLPWGGSTFDIATLNADGQLILKRSLLWARGIAGYWKLDETTGIVATDSSVNANNGTLTGGFTFDTASVSPAKLESGLSFNGTSDYVSIANSSTLQPTGAFTITAWIKGDAWSTGANVNAILRKGSTDPTNYQLAIADGKVALYLDDVDTGGIRGNTTLQANKWYHVAATWDGATAKIYVNGVLDNGSGTSKLGPIGTDTRALNIGSASTSDFFDGVMDDVRFYNYALDSTEVKAVKGFGQPKGVRVVKWLEQK